MYALNASTGAVVWSYATGGYVRSSPTVADGVVYVGSYDHNLYAFDLLGGTYAPLRPHPASLTPDLRLKAQALMITDRR